MISKMFLIINFKFLRLICYHCDLSNLIHTMHEVAHKSGHNFLSELLLGMKPRNKWIEQEKRQTQPSKGLSAQ